MSECPHHPNITCNHAAEVKECPHCHDPVVYCPTCQPHDSASSSGSVVVAKSAKPVRSRRRRHHKSHHPEGSDEQPSENRHSKRNKSRRSKQHSQVDQPEGSNRGTPQSRKGHSKKHRSKPQLDDLLQKAFREDIANLQKRNPEPADPETPRLNTQPEPSQISQPTSNSPISPNSNIANIAKDEPAKMEPKNSTVTKPVDNKSVKTEAVYAQFTNNQLQLVKSADYLMFRDAMVNSGQLSLITDNRQVKLDVAGLYKVDYFGRIDMDSTWFLEQSLCRNPTESRICIAGSESVSIHGIVMGSCFVLAEANTTLGLKIHVNNLANQSKYSASHVSMCVYKIG